MSGRCVFGLRNLTGDLSTIKFSADNCSGTDGCPHLFVSGRNMVEFLKSIAPAIGAVGSVTSVGLILYQILSGAFSFVYTTRDDIAYLKSSFVSLEKKVDVILSKENQR